MRLALTGLHSIQPGSEGIALLERATLPDGSPAFDEPRAPPHAGRSRPARHGVPRPARGRARTPRGGVALHRSARWRRTCAARASRSARSLTLAVAVLPVPVILLGFDGFLLRFHEVFFSGDSWRFSDTDTLLRIYPEVFWQDTAKLAAGMAVAQAVVVALASWWWLRRLRLRSVRSRRRRRDRAAPAEGGVLRIGHRGAAALAPENTLRAFRAAVDVGVDLIEFDVLDLRTARSSSRTRTTSTRSATAPRGGRVREPLARGAARGRARAADARRGARVLRRRGAATSGCTSTSSCGRGSTSSARRSCGTASTTRTVVSGVHVPACGRSRAPRRSVRIGLTYPEDRLVISRRALPLADRLARAHVAARVGRDPPAPARPPAPGRPPSCSSTGS